ncbi:fungal-specific transcription factor domain-containing protein [Aspergillus avenaceus]|uniref:Fungal-specific transcription factor domain-containing protein n=1 Tax=Aspergillus avenaceus TaxID=36643 RepID=A0A5N6TXM9_ASPAV|nr:fungal-specific transcription factor domain-containing protein [Aspergillus avenaceus]
MASGSSSCSTCNRKKVKCDKKQPCGACTKAGVNCTFPEPKRALRKLNRLPISEPLTRLTQLEDETKILRSEHRAIEASATSSRDSQYSEGDVCQSTTSPNLNRRRGRLVVKDGQTRYLDQEASVTLGDQVRELWKLYQSNVAPLISMLHLPTMARLVQDASATARLDPPREALLLSVCFASVVSMKPKQCQSVLGQDHDTACRDYRHAVDQALARANVIKSHHLYTLQAAVPFLLCSRVGGDTRLVWAASAVVIRIAQGQGIHRDGRSFGLTPFETEIRRRLWWHICILDMLTSEDEGVDTVIGHTTFDARLPVNLDDDDITPSMTDLPPEKTGFTDVTICILSAEVLTNLYWNRRSLLDDGKMTSERQESRVKALAERLHERYLDHFDLENPIHWMVATIARLQLSKEWLAAHFQALASDTQELDARSNDSIFYTAVEILKFAFLLQSNKAMAQWSWLCKSYKQWHVIAFILSQLCTRPINPETDHAWEVATAMYKLLTYTPPTDTILEKPLKLREHS